MKAKTGYQIVFWAFVAITVVSYLWTACSVLRWIINLF